MPCALVYTSDFNDVLATTMSDDRKEGLTDVDPLEQLAALAVGFDVRRYSSLYDLVSDISEFGDHPSRTQWQEIVDLVLSQYKHDTVSVGQSLAAVKELASYRYAKKKPTDGDELQGEGKVTELSEKEVSLFREKFNNEF